MLRSLCALFVLAAPTVALASHHDFLVDSAKNWPDLRPRGVKSLKADSCRANIAHLVCLVDPLREGESPLDRKCLEGSAEYAAPIEALHDQLPPELQRMFCGLRFVFIEKESVGMAHASVLRDEKNNVVGAGIGVRRSVIDDHLDASRVLTWKEQLSFGTPKDSYEPNESLPTVNASSRTPENHLLYFLVVHEFGHIFDFTNGLNPVGACKPAEFGKKPTECAMSEAGWGGIGWLTNLRPKPENDFALRHSLCFYWCNGNALSHAQVPDVYEGFGTTDFLSLYATMNPWEDFAESFAFHFLAKRESTTFEIDTKQIGTVDILEKFHSPALARKREYIRAFLARPDIRYP